MKEARSHRTIFVLLGLLILAALPAQTSPPADLTPEFTCPPCNDLNACTIDSCDTARGICRFEAVSCDDGNPCTSDPCYGDPQGSPCGQAGCCHLSLSNIACDDRNSCTGGDHCSSGTCVATNLAPGTACDDQNPCTGPDACNESAQCLGEILLGSECDDRNVCTYIDFCDETGSCIGVPFDPGYPCEDGNVCTTVDICDFNETGFTVCRGTPVYCSDGSPCTEDQCDSATGQCSNPPVNCDDGNPCTGNLPTCTIQGVCDIFPLEGNPCSIGPCQTGFCNRFGQCVLTQPPCDDQNFCTEDVCDASTGACSHNPTTNPCDDFNPCTFGDNCATGSCMGTFDAQAGTPTVSSYLVAPTTLTPANHMLVEVTTSLNAQAACGGTLTPILASITSSQSDDAPGPSDGNTVGDIQNAQLGTADYSFLLRAERDRNLGPRIYTITYSVTSSNGVTISEGRTVTVPLNKKTVQPEPQSKRSRQEKNGGESSPGK